MNQQRLIQGLASLGLSVSDTQIWQFARYSALLKEWNEKMNLTAICDDDGITVKHFLDSVLLLKEIELPAGAAVADVGTGAGFPGLPLKILRPDCRMTLIDSLQKRVGFLSTVCEELSLTEVSCIHGRAEELGRAKAYRERFDLLVSRAVANLRVLSEYCLPFVKAGGCFVALKAQEIDEELAQAKPMIGTLGARVEQVLTVPLPGSEILRKLVVMRKTAPTPPQFPRRPNQIKRES